MITYEFPLIERVRTLLRLEDLFDRAQHFIERPHHHDHHFALTTLFEILEVSSRAELKSELLQELERQRQVMHGLQGNDQVDRRVLTRVLAQLDAGSAGIFNMTGKIGQYLRENDWLMQVKQRTSIPGGACEFDLPHYHQWLNRPPEARAADLNNWIAPLYPIRDSVHVVLGLLRESGVATNLVAKQGSFQQMLGGRVAQMVRIRLADDAREVPEVSANKYAVNVRFTMLGEEPRPRVAESDVAFELTFFNL
jgi:cell division protein ZapD